MKKHLSLSNLIQKRMDVMAYTNDQVVDLLDHAISYSTFLKIKSGLIKRPSCLHRLCEVLHIDINQITTSDNENKPGLTSNPKHVLYGPIISWREAGLYFHQKDFKKHPAHPLPSNAGPNTFCLVVQDESMVNMFANSPYTYSVGSIIYVDPDQEINVGQRGIFKLASMSEAILRELTIDIGIEYLMPLHFQYRLVRYDKSTAYIGRVIGRYTPD